MKYAVDTNIIVFAVTHHMRVKGTYPARYAASARVFARRRRVPLVIPACFLGEAIQGAGADSQRLELVIALCAKGAAAVAEPSRKTLVDSILLRRQLRRGDNSRMDCLGYAIAAQEQCGSFVSYDAGFIGKDNRFRVPSAYRRVRRQSSPPECYTAEEIMQQKINPRRRQRERKDPILVAWERRANAAARAAGATTDLEVARFFCGTARAFMEEHGLV
jgi:hypothetical protein